MVHLVIIIGYLRIISCAAAYVYAFSNPGLSVILYFLGAGLDAVDGVAARALNQCSELGRVLDMLSDRMGTLVLFMVIAQQDPSIWGLCAFFIVLDIVSHWCQMYVTLASGKASHKGSENGYLNFYYNGPYVLFLACSGNELFIMLYYLLGTPEFGSEEWVIYAALFFFPIFVYKQLMNVVQLAHNMNKLVALDVKQPEDLKHD